MEMEFFVKPGTDEEWHERWIETRLAWYRDLGLNPENLRLFEHPEEKRSHYSKRTVDIEYRYGFQGSEWGELEGHRQPDRLSTCPPTRRRPARTCPTSTRRPASGTCRT